MQKEINDNFHKEHGVNDTTQQNSSSVNYDYI